MIKKVVITSSIIICIVLFVYLTMPAVAIWGESLFVRCDIHNPYVNSGFRGWSLVQIEDFDSFLIPNGWSLEEDSGIYWIIEDSGEAWAFGAIIGSDESCFANYKELIATVHNTPCREIEIDPFSRFLMMKGSDIDLLQIHGDMLDYQKFCIQMFETSQKEIVWILMSDLSLDETQYDIAEAMVYSFAFNAKQRR